MKSPFPQRRPLVFVVLLLLVVLVTYFLAGAITIQFKLSSGLMALIADGVLALIALFLLTHFYAPRDVGFRLPSDLHSMWFFAIPCLSVVINLAFFGIGNPGIGRILLFLAAASLIGFVEETYFRGMMLRALLKRGPWQAVIISSLLFGVMHLLNMAGGAPLVATLLQVVGAVAFGLTYAALVLRTETIIPGMAIHSLTNFVAFIAWNATLATSNLSTQFYAVSAGEAIVFTAYSIILMRHVKRQVFEATTEMSAAPPVAALTSSLP